MQSITITSLLYKRVTCLLLILVTSGVWAQDKRIKPPKRDSNIESVDGFVNHTFDLYNKVFVYDSLTQKGVEIPAEYEDAILEDMEKNLDSMYQILPVVIEDMGGQPFAKKAKGTLNLNKARRALTFSIRTVKVYFLGESEKEEN
ncbi:hypothetical protein [Ulvibacter litoralis]|uniref:Uncharacterized protein n=1 Tax=Ulvibacter litoralis TaxID=227084 RepID=A0A1G7FF10_9FLAO|nr:hypothetical protein [Ulvibacter litoralis]GHC51403.1 hypothetical protein GCM10008083_13830 [Ulvibacter litoralis]SDE74523.1 hypothetical protein SAMN05421855_102523 [Ulvibacter litoralis]